MFYGIMDSHQASLGFYQDEEELSRSELSR